jgi:hypothetical protein
VAASVTRMTGVVQDEERARRKTALLSEHITALCQEHAQEKLSHFSPECRDRIIRHALALHHLSKERQLSELDAFVEMREQLQTLNGADEWDAFTGEELDEFENSHPQKISSLVFAYLTPEEHLTLSSLREHLEFADKDEEECRWLATLLSTWCRDGAYGRMFDGVGNVNMGGKVVHFELGLIPESAKEMKAVIGFVAINFIRNLVLGMPRHERKRVVIEEVSRFLDVPGGADILQELFQQFRKFHVQTIIVGQQWTCIADTRIKTAVVGNARAWWIFNTGDPRDVERLCADLNLPAAVCETILRFPRPDQMVGEKYSEFLYFHTAQRFPICGVARYHLLPTEIATDRKPTTNSN